MLSFQLTGKFGKQCIAQTFGNSLISGKARISICCCLNGEDKPLSIVWGFCGISTMTFIKIKHMKSTVSGVVVTRITEDELDFHRQRGTPNNESSE